MDEEQKQISELALNVLKLSRNTLLVNLRFLDMALSRFKYHEIEEGSLLTDGELLLYNPKHILHSYKTAKEIPVRDYLHIVMHCVFRHMFMDPTLSRPHWDLACDIAVENIITELGLKSTQTFRERGQAEYIEEIKKEVGILSAEKIYAYLCEHYSDLKKLALIRGMFYADNHEIWYMTYEEIVANFKIQSRTKPSQSNGDGDGNGENNKDGQSDGEDNNAYGALRRELAEAWREIAERMQVDMETFGKQQGYGADSMVQNLREVNREKYDYTEFLKKFAVMGEAMKLNLDEFDYIFYTYGLELYERMPLIEPLEYKDVKKIKEFVIAIDTSGSTSGELVQTFLQKTFNILKSTESFFSKINLHIIQCDADIQEDAKITTEEEFDNYIKTMTIRGLGGTDFRPVFDYVEKLQNNKEFTNLKGLIYFTDGFGDFPNKKPPYETAFVFIDDDYNNYDIPPWAIKLILKKDEI